MKTLRHLSILVGALLLFSSLSAQLLSSPESIVYDSMTDRYLISNAADSRLVQENAVGEQSYFGLEGGSHGLAIIGRRLFSCKKGEVLIHDLDSEELLARYAVHSARFLNGLCTDGLSRLYATDFSGRRVYQLDFDGDRGLSHTGLVTLNETPNGIAYDEESGDLRIVTWGRSASVLTFDLGAGVVSKTIATPYDNLESIISDGEGDFYISAWVPSHLLKMTSAGIIEEIEVGPLDRPSGLAIGRGGELVMLGSDSRSLHKTSVSTGLDFADIEVSVFPNPIVSTSLISYRLTTEDEVVMTLYDSQGRFVRQVSQGSVGVGDAVVLFDRGDVPSGMYFLNIRTTHGEQAVPLTLVD